MSEKLTAYHVVTKAGRHHRGVVGIPAGSATTAAATLYAMLKRRFPDAESIDVA